ncbi:hypothetical protein [Natronobacterium texcoconense]|uniref:Uncharacterized protein n=1 Tax=Natronobacterium texcoconense TaxID=1095778 RepID=A0A1H1CDU4_NATTX|nr:hypothetical protein [Natronobacterium texcoconense]SDQ62387.1 hypothetical protein SAMN04489842_1371 [Natronobacterium texcoconense]
MSENESRDLEGPDTVDAPSTTDRTERSTITGERSSDDDTHVTGLCPTVESYVLAERDGDEATCLICGEPLEHVVYPEDNGTGTLEVYETIGRLDGDDRLEHLVDNVTDERILRLHFDGAATPFYADYRQTDDGLEYVDEGNTRDTTSVVAIGYRMATATFHEFVPLEKSLFVEEGTDG